jgi:hypothetical protein
MGSLAFRRIVSIDWSGAGSEHERVDLAIAIWEQKSAWNIQLPPVIGSRKESRKWKRSEVRQWLASILSDGNSTLVAMDFGFGLPWGADRAIFSVDGWRPMIHKIADLYGEQGTARAAAQAINALPAFSGHGPFRFNETRHDYRFYVQKSVAYYRLTELAAPQAISQWYLGSGGTVGFHTITGLSTINHLVDLREEGRVRFKVWPHETLIPEGNTLIESYPALCPKLAYYGPCQGDDEEDAWKVLEFLVGVQQAGRIAGLFDLQPLPFGRAEGVEFQRQVQFEGYILGLNEFAATL